jgi:hypothetical protein
MANDITLDAGDTWYESVTLTNNATPPVPVNLTNALNIVFVALSAGRVILRKHMADATVVITNATGYDGASPPDIVPQFMITFNPDDTSPAFGIGSTTATMTYPYELRVTFADGTQELVIKGNSLIIGPCASCTTEVATFVDSIVQGVF